MSPTNQKAPAATLRQICATFAKPHWPRAVWQLLNTFPAFVALWTLMAISIDWGYGWTLLLAILAFSLSLIGTFLVRSGVLTSVHTFASDPTRGVFILMILVLFIGGGLALFA